VARGIRYYERYSEIGMGGARECSGADAAVPLGPHIQQTLRGDASASFSKRQQQQRSAGADPQASRCRSVSGAPKHTRVGMRGSIKPLQLS